MGNFIKDKNESDILTKDFVNPILEKHKAIFVRNSNSKDRKERLQWDCMYKTPNGIITIEHKFDRQTKVTRNIFIEFEDRGKPSGISTSTAEYYTYLVLDDEPKLYITPTSVLKEKIVPLHTTIVKGGDNYLAKGYLINIDKCKEFLTCMN
mgnify:CR=1 FL=1|tara:strand:- start:31 stop:483 length:453 start_codon:yes stop_codon:yes gene_type:complete